jgi:hypothetical protein
MAKSTAGGKDARVDFSQEEAVGFKNGRRGRLVCILYTYLQNTTSI